jgi:hypothetical protein
MAEWRPNAGLYGQGGGEYVDDTGQIWPDPWGTLAPPSGAGSAPAAAPTPAEIQNGFGGANAPAATDFLQSTGQTSGALPAAPAAAPADSGQGVYSKLVFGGAPPGDPAAPPTPAPGLADRPQTAAAGAPPTPQPGLADTVNSTTNSTASESGSTGLSAEAQARQSGMIGQAATAKGEAAVAKTGATLLGNQLDVQVAQGNLKAAADEMHQNAAKIALNDTIQADVERKMKEGSDWMPDRTALFSGDHGTAFGIFAAIAAAAGGWQMGRLRSTQNPFLPSILKMIDDNVADQVRRNSQTMQTLRDHKGDLKSATLELRQRQLLLAQKRLENIAVVEKSPAVQAGAAAMLKDMQAQNLEWEQGKRQAIERQVTSKVTRTIGGTKRDLTPEEQKARAGGERSPEQAKAQSVLDLADAAYTKAGLVRDRTGRWVVAKGGGLESLGGTVPPGFIESINPFSDNGIKAASEALAEGYGRLQSGGAISDPEREAFREQIGMNTGNRQQLAAHANALETGLRSRLKSTDESASPTRKDKINDPDKGAF